MRKLSHGGWFEAGVLVVVVAALIACGGASQESETAASAEEPPSDTVTAPSGGQGFVVTCTDPKECVQQAANRCRSGYEFRPLGETGKKSTATDTKGAAVVLEGAGGPIAVGREKGETETVSERQFLVECRQKQPTGIGAPCDTPDDCVRLRVAMKNAGLGAYISCQRNLDAQRVCTFACAVAEDSEASERLTKLCTALARTCIETGAEGEPATCQSQ